MQLGLWNELLLLIETIFKSKDNIRKETESFISSRGFRIVSLNIMIDYCHCLCSRLYGIFVVSLLISLVWEAP